MRPLFRLIRAQLRSLAISFLSFVVLQTTYSPLACHLTGIKLPQLIVVAPVVTPRCLIASFYRGPVPNLIAGYEVTVNTDHRSYRHSTLFPRANSNVHDSLVHRLQRVYRVL